MVSYAMAQIVGAYRYHTDSSFGLVVPKTTALISQTTSKISKISLVNSQRYTARWGLQQTHPGLRAATRHGVNI